jgi:hypothetical protein
MSLGAYVNCSCYRRGKTTPFPLVEWEGRFRFDVEGVLGLDLPYEGFEREHDMVQHWMQGACEHDDMELISEQITNWTGYMAFLQSLVQIGWRFFPILQQELPRNNSDFTSAPLALKILRELDIFVRLVKHTRNAFLINTLDNYVIQEYMVATKGVFVLNKDAGYRMGIDPKGFFIEHQSPSDEDIWIEKFRAKQFEQRIFKRDETSKPLHVEFYCAETEVRFATDIPLIQYETMGAGKLLMPHYPTAMHVELRQMDVKNFTYILDPLYRICHESVCTGNPIVWF